MAGQPLHAHLETAAARDLGDDAERQVAVQQHRALLDMHFDEPRQRGRIDRRGAQGVQAAGAGQAGLGQRLAHGYAVRVRAVQQGRVEAARQHAAGQEAGLEAQPFLLGEADDLEVIRQPDTRRVERAHHRNRQQDAEPPVIPPAVAHGVEVGAGHQHLRRGHGRIGRIPANHIADGVHAHCHAGGLHPLHQLRLRPAMRRREVRAGQPVLHIGVGGERGGAVEDGLAERGKCGSHGLERERGQDRCGSMGFSGCAARSSRRSRACASVSARCAASAPGTGWPRSRRAGHGRGPP
ncbi:hypothetical protein D3C81_1131670 [compost metagenome]